MKKKYFKLALAFLCLFIGQVSYGMSTNEGEDDKICFGDDCEPNKLPEVVIYPKPKESDFPGSQSCFDCDCDPTFCPPEDTDPPEEDCIMSGGNYCDCYGIGCDDGDDSKLWVLDADRDKYFDSSQASVESEESPGADYIYSSDALGPDCDDSNSIIHKLNKCGKCEVEPEPEPEPCDKEEQNKIKNQIKDPNLEYRFEELRNSLESSSSLIETGFAIYENEIGMDFPSKTVTGSETEPSIQISLDVSDTHFNPVGMVHTHPSGVFPSPSPGDFYALATAFTSINTITTSYVVAADGTTYAMNVDDPTALATFLATYPASENVLNESYKPGSPMQGLYQEAFDSFRNAGLSDAVAEERANAVIMAEAGIHLLKAPENSNDFKQIQGTKTVDSKGKIKFTKSDCP